MILLAVSRRLPTSCPVPDRSRGDCVLDDDEVHDIFDWLQAEGVLVAPQRLAAPLAHIPAGYPAAPAFVVSFFTAYNWLRQVIQ